MALLTLFQTPFCLNDLLGEIAFGQRFTAIAQHDRHAWHFVHSAPSYHAPSAYPRQMFDSVSTAIWAAVDGQMASKELAALGQSRSFTGA